ncbi:glutamine synthetase family protein [Salipiger sp. 1_MG-2023]|uniref:glutamine synthetase family protein n=1 Tax=Salipiger sp. 1_MG-2023 TaxID=3062665 RepID=UPI0026E32BDC|nr:glutamine synthetase family protein [Salipiger sp. 1_MG-2023]MDO6588516.1 glutamine synthetase family protein [Salipiger sp. 1_MG-2023]
MTQRNNNLLFVGTNDIAGILRGKSFPVGEWDKRSQRGVGWTPTNVQITCFDSISDSPFGSFGDLALVPDPQTRITIDHDQKLDFAMGDIRTLEGAPWEFCTRSLARRAIEEFHALTGATVLSSFEHEFQLKGQVPRPGDAFGFKGFRDGQAWAEAYLAALSAAGCAPDTFMKEYGPGQYEITMKPAQGITSADNAAILRMLTHDVLTRFGKCPSFAPILDPDSVGNGLHVHFSFLDDAGEPLTWEEGEETGMSTLTRHFIGGVLKYLDQILAILAPSEISYLRLTPHRWSAAYNNLGFRDREASVRICPVTSSDPESIARQYNFEVRAADNAASPYLTLAALVFAGAQGVRDAIEPPAPAQEDLSLLSPEALAAKGFRRLPDSLGKALEALRSSEAARGWFGDGFVDLYVAHKQGELAQLEGLDWPAKCARYAEVY